MFNTCRLSVSFLILLLFSPEGTAHQATPEKEHKFRLSMFEAPDTRQSDMMTRLYQDLFRRLGIAVEIESLPMKRASMQANSGKIDGEAARIASYGKIHTHMRRVDFPVAQVIFVAYARKSDQMISEDGWDALVKGNYRIGYLRGILFSERMLHDKISPVLLSQAKSVRQGLLKVLYGRTDLFIHTRGDYLEKEKMNDRLVEASVVQTVPLYMYVHQSHQALIPKIEQALHQMKEEGRFLEICHQIYQKYASKHCLASSQPYSRIQW
ncbi:hypothetical protein VA7868_00090 [Vibrio aerogenes CECT 7868]|uniref:Uncharacterized protein n=1 Tax=Vibrio aerogenes CECT 7868 TaxID=1216006 RepID=A0A1M5UH86_9VIBR|nr:transporter substrate-binding domain-containing protein [Vibrio aerogenes]SHH62327.1 hypothetical protein VA7868_00090 [Vibrio aerogenes CECT 7868]